MGEWFFFYMGLLCCYFARECTDSKVKPRMIRKALVWRNVHHATAMTPDLAALRAMAIEMDAGLLLSKPQNTHASEAKAASTLQTAGHHAA